MKKLHFKQNNRGAALLSIIIAMTVVALLGAAVLYAAYANLNMKVVNKKSQNNFYSAERVLDDMTASLEEVVSEAYTEAFSTTMADYGMMLEDNGSDQFNEQANDKFRTEFVLALVDKLKEIPEGEVTGNVRNYSIQKLKDMVTGTYPEGSTYNVAVETAERSGGNAMETLSDGLILRNIKVTYTDKEGYIDTIITDLKIITPTISFAQISSMPDIKDYCYIADSGVVVGANLKAALEGNAYSGNPKLNAALNPGVLGDEQLKSIVLQNGASLITQTEKSTLLVANGNVVMSNKAVLKTGSDTGFWFNNLEANSTGTAADAAVTNGNSITLGGKSYAADDITLNGTGNKLTLGSKATNASTGEQEKVGAYYGYGYAAGSKTNTGNASGTAAEADTRAAENSAIIVNGRATEIDFSNLNTLIVMGTAYVDSGSITAHNNTTNDKDILTGESVTVKSNQLAYLVSPKASEWIKSNPMSYSEWQKLDIEHNTELKNDVLSYYGYSTGSNVEIVSMHSANEGGTSYLYLNFDSEDTAAKHFRDLYKSNSATGTELRKYLASFVDLSKFKFLDEDAELVLKGNYMDSAASTVANGVTTWVADYSEGNSSNKIQDYRNALAGYASTYEALCTKLVTSKASLTTQETERGDVFANLIDEDQINKLFSDFADSKGTDEDSETVSVSGNVADFSTKDGSIHAYIVKGNYEVGASGGKGVIVATGNVTVKGSWEGVIICKGKLTVAATGLVFKSDASAVDTALKLSCSKANASGELIKDEDGNTTDMMAVNVFRNYENVSEQKSDDRLTISIPSCINYENWENQ